MANTIDLSGGRNQLIPNGVSQTKNSLKAHSREYADAIQRIAGADVTAEDVGTLALQLDTNMLWLLTGIGPVTWEAVGGIPLEAPEFCVTSPRAITNNDHGSYLLAAAYVLGGFTFTLPSTVSPGTRLRIGCLGFDLKIRCSGAGVIIMGAGILETGVPGIAFQEAGYHANLLYIGEINPGVYAWAILGGTGRAIVLDGSGAYTSNQFFFNSIIGGATIGNLLTVDARLQVADSGTAIAALRTRVATVSPEASTPRVILDTDSDNILSWTGVGTGTFALPDAATVGLGWRVRVRNNGSGPPTPTVIVVRAGADVIKFSGSTTSTSVTSTELGASLEFISTGAGASWIAMLGERTWTDGTITHHYDANIQGGTTGNLVSIDANDDIQDSGVAASTMAGYVVGPASATDNAIALFNTGTGKLIKDSGVLLDTYRYKAEQFIPVVATPYVVSAANDRGKWVLWGGAGTLNVTLPAASAMSSGGWIGVWNFGSASPRVNLNRAGADTLTIGNSTGSSSIYTTTRGSMARLVSNGVDGWLLLDAGGTWTNGTVTRHFDANLPTGATGNTVTIGAYGDIVDSGAPPVTAVDVASMIEASGGGGGSDMAIYSNIAGDFSVVQTGADTIGIFGLPFNISAVQIKKITCKPTGGVVSIIAARGATLVCTWQPDGTIAGKGTIMTESLGTMASTDEYIVEIEGPPKGYHAATDSAKAMVTNALHYCNDGLIADLTSDSVEIVKPLLSDGYNAFSLSVNIGAAGDKLTVLATNDPAGSTGYYDVTALALGVQAITVDGAYQTAEPLMFQWVKLVIDGHTSSIAVYMTRFRK